MMAYDASEKYRKDKEEAEKEQVLYDEIIQSLRNDSRLKEEFKEYDEESVEDFYRQYAHDKLSVLKYGPFYVKQHEETDLKWVEEATEGLNQIQQKKLFDLQCLWRAEKIELPEISISADFAYWEEHVFSCPFLEPVTEEEVEIYRKYLLSNNYEKDLDEMISWQDYDDIKEAYNSSDSDVHFPEWYDYHNSCTGKSMYLSLPDIRGEKEQYYMNCGSKEQSKKPEKAPPGGKVISIDKKTVLKYPDDDLLRWFANTFDDEETRKHLKDYEYFLDDNDDIYDDAVQLLDELSEHCDIWPIQQCDDWFEGLEKCLESYKTGKTADALGEAYEQYMMHINMGIGFAEDNINRGKDMMSYFRNAVLKGRKFCGEPEDFNF